MGVVVHDALHLLQAGSVQRRSAVAKPVRGRLAEVCPKLMARQLDVSDLLLRGWTQESKLADLGLAQTLVKAQPDAGLRPLWPALPR